MEELKTEVQSIKKNQKDLQTSIEKLQDKGSLNIDQFKVTLRHGAALLFCDSLNKQIPDESINRLVKAVLKDESRNIGITTAKECLKFVKKTLATFKAEERRRILGKPQCQKLAKLPTPELTEQIMKYLKAPMSKKKKYEDHVAIMRKYTRECPQCIEHGQFYQAYKEWLDKKYTAGVPMEEEIKAIRDEDTSYDYAGSVLLVVVVTYMYRKILKLNCVKNR